MQKILYTFHSVIASLLLLSCLCLAQNKLHDAAEAYKEGRYEGAAEILESEINADTPTQVEFEYLVNSYIALKNYEKAINALQRAVKYYPDNYQFLLTLGQLCTSEKMYEEGRGYLRRIKGKNQTVIQLLALNYYNHAVELYHKKSLDKSALLFSKCVETDPQNKNAYTNLISITYEQKKLNEAKLIIEKALKLFPDDLNYQKSYASILAETKDYKSAVRLLNKLREQDPSDTDIALRLAKVYVANYEIGKADTLFSDLLAKFSDNRIVYDEAVRHWNTFNRQDKIREAYLLMKQHFPDEADMDLKIGRTYELENNPGEAVNYYLSIIRKDSLNSKIHLALAVLYKKNNEESSAVSSLKKILAVTKDFYAYKMLNEIYLNKKDYPEAVALNKSMGDNYFGKYQLGLIYKKLNQRDSAIYFIEQADRLKPGDPFVLKEKAVFAKEESNKADAVKYAGKALRNSIQLLTEKQDLFKRKITERTKEIFSEEPDIEDAKQEIAFIGENIEQINEILKTEMSGSEYCGLLNDYLLEYPQSIFLLLFKAEELNDREQFNEAEVVYKKVIFLNPSLKKAHYGIAGVQCRLQKNNEAILSYRRALEMDKEDDQIYDRLISLHTQQNSLGVLSEQLQIMHDNNPDNKILKERLIEILHKTGRMKEAKKIINENKQVLQ